MVDWIAVLILIIVFIISAIPLWIAVKLLGGRTTLLKTAIVTFITGLLVFVIQLVFVTWGWLIAFIILIWVYKEIFDLGWIRAFLVWLVHLLFLWIITLIINLLLSGSSYVIQLI